MASAKDTAYRALQDDITGTLPAVAELFGYESDAEIAARELAKKREQAAQDDLAFRKATAEKNDASVEALRRQIFGGPPPSSTMPGPSQPAPRQQPQAPRGPSAPQGPVATDQYGAPIAGGTAAPNVESGAYFDPEQYLAGTAAAQAAQAAQAAPQFKEGATKRAGYTNDVAGVQDWNARSAAWQKEWEDYNNQWTLPKAYAETEAEHGKSVDDFVKAVSGIQDAPLVGYVGDIHSDATVSPETLARQNMALDKLQTNTDVKETAEERLMRELARRKMEGQMKGDREAMAQNLKARGVYGSGAELASQLGSQSETASRRALEELAAQANAQQRAMQALGQFSMATDARGKQDLEQGRLHDIVNHSNQQLKQQGEQFKARQQADQNRDRVTRETNTLNAKNQLTDRKDKHTNDKVNVATNLTGLETGSRTEGARLVSEGAKALDPLWAQQQASALANDNSGQPLTRLF